MSEYQYYEFQAVDRPLTASEMSELRAYSSRATITATRFTNHYDFGSFKGDTAVWMERYFDAFLYLANWGTHEFMLRLPGRVLDLDTAKRYCCGQAASVRSKGDLTILEFCSQDGEGEDWVDGNGWLSSLIQLRADLARGDHRTLYLAWLLCAQNGELADDASEPPIPAGLGELTAPLQAFLDFLRIDGDLISAAAARSPENDESISDTEVEKWIAALPDDAKTAWLVRLARGGEPFLSAELLRQFRESRTASAPHGGEAPRTVGELLDEAERCAEDRQRKEAERAAAERARREREEAEARERYLAALAQREAHAWRQVDALIATKQPARYDEAVELLGALHDLLLRSGRAGEIEDRLRRLCEEHSRKPSLLQRLQKAGLLPDLAGKIEFAPGYDYKALRNDG
jgi:hypothetical protein